MRRPYAAWNAPKGGNAVLTKFISWESFWFPKLSYNAPKGGNAVLTQDDQVSEVAILLGFNAPKGGNAVLTLRVHRFFNWTCQECFNAPKGGNAVLTNTRLIHITILMDYVSMPRRAVMLF